MPEYFVTDAVTGAVCPRCGAPQLTGWAEGLRARVDLVPLNRAGEVAAIVAGLWTYTLARFGLIYRDASRIRDPRLRGPVLSAHQCRRAIPKEHRAISQPKPNTQFEGVPY